MSLVPKLGALMLLCCGTLVVRAQQAVQQPAADAASARERWSHLTDEERERLRQRYDQFQKLSSDERRELVERAHRMRATWQDVQQGLTPQDQERLRALEPERRREAVREIVSGQARERGRQVRGKLPDVWVERLEHARPEERPAILAEFKEKYLRRIADGALKALATRLALPEEEQQRLRALPPEQRAQAVLELRKRAQERETSENGLPPGMTAADWQELQALSPESFYERIQEFRRRRMAEIAAQEEQQGLPQEQRAYRIPLQKLEGLQRLQEAVHERPGEVLELAQLPPEARELELLERRRARGLDVLRAYQLCPPQKLAELEAMDVKGFNAVMRHLLRPLYAMEHGGEHGGAPWMPVGGARGARPGPGPGPGDGPRGGQHEHERGREGAPPPARDRGGAFVPQPAPGLHDGGRC